MTSLTHKGFAASIQFDHEDRIYFGRITGIKDIIGFHGANDLEITEAFHEAVEDDLSSRKFVDAVSEGPA